jgi:hypothetical protein
MTIQRYGMFDPYIERGAFEGLRPHGPHTSAACWRLTLSRRQIL